MERIFNEQVERQSQTAKAEITRGDKTETTSLGKFKDQASLLKAYNRLEAEFTKRSQRLKLLEGECAKLSEQLEASKKGPSENEVFAQKDTGGIKPTADGGSPEKRESADTAATDGQPKSTDTGPSVGKSDDIGIDGAIKDMIIRKFLSEISVAKPTNLLSEGEIGVTPPIRPKDLNEAKEMAELFFKQ